jgi:ligand-binding sensor domain-containing protein/two-component sensor histidine kinase
MLINKKISLCFIFLFVFIPLAFSQYKFEQPVLISKEQGLPSNDIRSFQKGKDGFIWMGTSEGLSRFDGQQVKTFALTNDPDVAPFTNSVIAVLTTGKEIWAGTTQGISVMNCKDHTFRHYQFTKNGKADSLKKSIDQHVSVLFRDKAGKIWAGTRTRGVCMYDEAKDDFRFFYFSRKEYPPLFPAVGTDNTILDFEASQTNDSIIWAGTPAGLQEINKYTGHVSLLTYPQANKDYQIALNAFRRLYQHDDGLLYVGSWAAGVNVFDPVKKTFTPLKMKSEEGKKIISKAIGRIYRKSDHEMWISSMAGLVIYDSKLQDVTWYKFNNAIESEFYAVDYIDDANRVWHTDITGLEYFDPAMQQFSHYSFKELSGPEWGFAFYIIPDKSGNTITVCPRLTDGLYRFDRSKKTWTKFLFPVDKVSGAEKDAIRGFVQLPSGDFIISADRGIFVYSEKTKQVSTLRRQLPFSLARRGEILLDHLGNLWISDDAQGLIKWKPGANDYRFYKTNIGSGDTSILTGRVINLFEDSRGNLWFQRMNGFGIYIAARDSIENFLYTKNEKNSFPDVHAFAEDRKGRIWINSEEGNIGYALSSDPEKGIVYKLNRREQEKPVYLPGMAVDTHGDVWGYSSKELFKINADDLSFTTYSFSYGIGEVDFFHFSFLPSGEMIFGGRNDIIIANPAELKRNTEIPVPYIDELEVLNQPFSFDPDGSQVRLNYKQNFFLVRFSAQAYTMPKDVRFRYRLKGFDDWTEVKGRRFANYTNVPGGDFVFQLQAANNEGVWNEKVLELPIYVSTSFWRSGWFRIGIVLFIAGTVYWFYRYRIDQLKKKQKMKLEYEKKLANVEMTALLAQMNPHFLFNSLNSIDSYIIRNESKKASEYLNNFARLIRLILQNSRSNNISLKDELEALDLYLQMERLRFKDKFEYEIKVEKGADTASTIIPPMLIQPYVENAIWHGLMHKKDGTVGKVEILISRENGNLTCIVKDNGIGREKAEEIKAQKPGNRKKSMGMQITSDRIEMINKLYNANTSVKITDLKDENGNATGTKVELVITV